MRRAGLLAVVLFLAACGSTPPMQPGARLVAGDSKQGLWSQCDRVTGNRVYYNNDTKQFWVAVNDCAREVADPGLPTAPPKYVQPETLVIPAPATAAPLVQACNALGQCVPCPCSLKY